MAERKLDIITLLNASDRRNLNWLSKQSEEARKEFAPVVVLRWAATVNDGPESYYMLLMVNERMNVHLFELHKHPELIYKMLASGGIGAPLRHQWLAGHKRKSEVNKAYELLARYHPDANDRELSILMSAHTKKSFSDFVEECGIQPDVAKEIKKAYDKIDAERKA